MKTIYNTYVVMESQEQCDRMKKLCIDNNLPIWKDEIAFAYFFQNDNFTHSIKEGFFIACEYEYKNKTQVTEQEFIELLKTK